MHSSSTDHAQHRIETRAVHAGMAGLRESGAHVPPIDLSTTYPLPETIKVTEPTRYSYVIINDHPVVVEKTTRRVVHTW
jgi:cystathionine beta-lyase/cystathionine gamma-synthase